MGEDFEREDYPQVGEKGEESSQLVSESPQTEQGISFSESTNQTINKDHELLEIDKELEELLKKQHAKVKVFGIGGGGGNTISRMKEIGIKGGEFIALNTDAQDLLYNNSDYKILIGKELTMGLGAGSNPKIGEEAAHESEQEIKKKLTGCDMVFITCGLGGGTGTGAAPVVAQLAKKQGALTIGVVTLPFTIEGRKRIENSEYGLERMESIVDTLIVIPNDKLLEIAPELPLQTAFKVADEILTNAVKGTTELVTKSGLVNLDFADIKTVMSNGGVSLMGMGESDSANRAQETVEKALNNPLLDVDISNAHFSNSNDDDALNTKMALVKIENSSFKDTSSDGIDIDFAKENSFVIGNTFVNVGGDAIDVSFSDIPIQNNKVAKCGDKGISIGEVSQPVISNNSISECDIGIAIKDLSEAIITSNTIFDNNTAVSLYRKKDEFGGATAILGKNDLINNAEDIKTDSLSKIIYE